MVLSLERKLLGARNYLVRNRQQTAGKAECVKGQRERAPSVNSRGTRQRAMGHGSSP